METFAATGETGLAALDQAEARLGHQQMTASDLVRLSLARAAVLIYLDRDHEARAVASAVVKQLKDDDTPFVAQFVAALQEMFDHDVSTDEGT